jgi:hypothetical protein
MITVQAASGMLITQMRSGSLSLPLPSAVVERAAAQASTLTQLRIAHRGAGSAYDCSSDRKPWIRNPEASSRLRVANHSPASKVSGARTIRWCPNLTPRPPTIDQTDGRNAHHTCHEQDALEPHSLLLNELALREAGEPVISAELDRMLSRRRLLPLLFRPS